MKEILDNVNEFASCLKEAAVWKTTKEPLASVMDEHGKVAEDNYIYEFYCYLSIITDLMHVYEIRFVEGKGNFMYKFPQAAAIKKDKPRFEAYINGEKQFQICAGTKVGGLFSSEDNHPDISFQLPNATEVPTYNDLICIMDAKYKEGKNAKLPKDEVYKFKAIIDLFALNSSHIKYSIIFTKFLGIFGNALVTNAQSYTDENDTAMIRAYHIKEVENFFPQKKFKIIG
jgi:hypothetical protein